MDTSTSAHRHSYTRLPSGSIRYKVFFSSCKTFSIYFRDADATSTPRTQTFGYISADVNLFFCWNWMIYPSEFPGLYERVIHPTSITNESSTAGISALQSVFALTTDYQLSFVQRHVCSDCLESHLAAGVGLKFWSSWSNILLINNSACDGWFWSKYFTCNSRISARLY